MLELLLDYGLSVFVLVMGGLLLLTALLGRSPPWVYRPPFHSSHRLPLVVAGLLSVSLSFLMYRQTELDQERRLTAIQRYAVAISNSTAIPRGNPEGSQQLQEVEEIESGSRNRNPANSALGSSGSGPSPVDQAATLMGLDGSQSVPSPSSVSQPDTVLDTSTNGGQLRPMRHQGRGRLYRLSQRDVPRGPIEVVLFNRLGQDQQNENLELIIEGRSVGRWEVSQDQPEVKAILKLPRPGLLNYQIMGTSLLVSGRRALLEGVGCLELTQGKKLEVRRLASGQLALQSRN